MTPTVCTVLDIALDIALGIAIRTAGLVAVDLGYTWLLDTFDSSPDADIGAGVLGFLLVAVVAGTWGLVDGIHRSVPRLAITWIMVGLLAAVAAVVRINVGDAPFDARVFTSDLRDLTPFLTGLVAVPALLGGGLTAVLCARPRTTPA
jgi:hypothetical protein